MNLPLDYANSWFLPTILMLTKCNHHDLLSPNFWLCLGYPVTDCQLECEKWEKGCCTPYTSFSTPTSIQARLIVSQDYCCQPSHSLELTQNFKMIEHCTAPLQQMNLSFHSIYYKTLMLLKITTEYYTLHPTWTGQLCHVSNNNNHRWEIPELQFSSCLIWMQTFSLVQPYCVSLL